MISKKGLVATINNKIKKEEIVKKVNNVTTLFTSKFSKNIAGLRGSNPIDTENRNLELEKLYTELNNLLLPKSFNLETYDHIIFVPIYNLSILPFSAFKLNNDYIIDKMSFSIAPSLFELMVSKNINLSKHEYNDTIYFFGIMHYL